MEKIKRTKQELTTCYLLRQAFSRSMWYWETIRAAKTSPDQYKCGKCQKIFKLREIAVDHKIPVVDPILGWQGVVVFAHRLFCEFSNLWVLCIDECHSKKTKKENKIRKENK